jgi:hypothetical protein
MRFLDTGVAGPFILCNLKMRRVCLILALLAAPLGAAACSGDITARNLESTLQPGEQQITLYVASRIISCQGEGITRCMRVREHPSDAWQAFYGGIHGFAYEEGFDYKLQVATRVVPNPPADASSMTFRLLYVESRTRVLISR